MSKEILQGKQEDDELSNHCKTLNKDGFVCTIEPKNKYILMEFYVFNIYIYFLLFHFTNICNPRPQLSEENKLFFEFVKCGRFMIVV